MNKAQRETELKKLAKSPQGQALKDFLEEQIKNLNDMSTVETWEETLGRKFSIKKMKEVMRKLELLKDDVKPIAKEDYN